MSRRREVLRYRWEFMRRSDEYLEAYRRVMELRDTARPLWEDQRIEVSDWRFIYRASPQYQEELTIAEPFGLRWMHDPDLEFDEIADKEAFIMNIPESRSYYRDTMDSKAVTTTFESTDKLTIEIDFSKAGFIEALEDEIRFRLAAHWALHSKTTTRKKTRLTNLDTILKAGELEGEGLSRTEIASRLYPSQDPDEESTRDRVRKLLNRWHAMISGEWRKLRYP
jgi:hypothetical protein